MSSAPLSPAPVSFGWPWMLLGLLAVPLIVWWYRRLLHARRARRAALAELGLIAPVAAVSRWRRTLPALLLLGSLVLLLTALARPQASVPTPRRDGTVILAVDVSASMAATDLAPSRIEAAKAAARALVVAQPDTVRVGVVAFAGSALVTQEATADRAMVLAAIDRLGPQGGTGLGRGLQASLGAIVGQPVLVDGSSESSTNDVEPQGQDLGYHGSAAIVLLSDGENTDEPDPMDVADLASSAGVRVFAIGLGRPEGTVLEIDGFQIATALDEPLLREVAARTDGRYFAAADGQQLAAVYDAVDLGLRIEAQRIELTGPLAAVAAVLLLAGVELSLAWFGRAV